MKRSLIISVFLLSCLIVQAGHGYILSTPLDGNTDYHYTANNHIILEKGFLSEPRDGHEVVLTIDAFDISAFENGITGGTTNNSNNGVVGSLGGTVDISLLGGAIYSIPIELPKGLGDIQPQLSIFYNNQERNGLLGWGWNLGGLSSISRTGSTPYHDGYYGINDRFCLDGNRLLKTGSGSYGSDGASYRTEQDMMSKIVSYQEAGISGPSYFKVWTADGRIMYYGHSDDSKAFVDPMKRVNLWLLNRVEDRNGNYMEFHYTIGKDTYRLDEIVYSGNTNDNINPELSVVFNYIGRDDIDITYLGNCLYRKKQLLNRITILNKAKELYSYSFTYQQPNPQKGYYYNTLTKILLNAGNEHFNPTLVEYGNNNYSAVSGNDLKYQVSVNGNPNAFNNAVKFNGDINGDGFDDVVAVQPNSTGHYDHAEVFFNKGLSDKLVFDPVRSFNLSPNISWIQVADLNGDGLDDIVFTNRIRGTLFFPDHIETEIYLSHMNPSGGFDFIRKYVPICSVPQNMVEAHLIGDFFGEGKNSILIQSTHNNKSGLESSLLFRYDEISGEFIVHEIPEYLNASRFFTADFNGDCITEIMYKKENGTTAMAQLVSSGNTYHYNEVFCGSPCDWDDCFPGDYNGDGLIDVLFFSANASQKWVICLSTQKGFGSKLPLPQNFPYSSPGDYLFSLDRPHHTIQYIKTGDFDGNGCSDLALFKDDKFFVFYGPIRSEGIYAPFANIQKISASAFHQYDNMGVCIGNFLGQERLSYLGTTTLSRLPSATLRNEVCEIIDGLGRKTEFAYDYLMPNPNNPSANDFYQINSIYSNHSRHVHNIAIPLRALKKLTTYNVSNKPVTTQCFYEGGLIHNQGRGFLGFSKTRQDDYCNGQLQKKTIRQYEIDYTYDVIFMNLMEEDVFDRNETLMARSLHFGRIYSNTQNNKVFIPISNKSIEAFDIDHPNRLLKKEIYETEVATHCSQVNKYNDVLSVTGQAKGTTTHQDYTISRICEYQEIQNTEYLNNDLASWIINRPYKTHSIAHREGDPRDVCQQRVFTYDDKKPFHVISILDLPNNGDNPNDPMAQRTDYEYDLTGNITSQTISTPNDQNSPRRETFEYHRDYGRRLLTKRTDAMDQEYHFTYDPVYNYCNSSTDCNGMTTVYNQDPLGVTINIQHPDGTLTYKVLRWSNNSFFQWEKHTGQETKWNYFAPTGEALRTNHYDLEGDLIISEFKYDDFGRIAKKWEPHKINTTSNNYHKYEYDSHNQVCRIYHPDGSFEEIEHDGNFSRTIYHAPEGNAQENSKTTNVMGWVIKSTDSEGNSVIYDYRADGKPIWSQIEGFPETRIEMSYDALGNKAVLSDPDYGTTRYEYNAFGELTRQITPKQDEIQFYYDPLGRIVTRIENNKKNHLQETTTWTYGEEKGQQGLLTQISSPNQIIRYSYDQQLRLSSINETVLGNEYQTSYTYDQASRVIGINYPTRFQVNYYYTSEGFLKSITDSNSNDLWKTMASNEMMQPSRVILGNGVVTDYAYDKETHRLASILTTKGSEVLQDLSYQYDHYSNMIKRDDYKNNYSEQFRYDNLNRLIDVNGTEGHSAFCYDPLGRMTEKTTAGHPVFYNADYTGPKPHALKTIQSPQGVFHQTRMDIVYNTIDKAETISEGTNSISFTYGYDHNRIQMTEHVDGMTRNKTYVNNCEFITNSKGDLVERTFLSGPSGVFAVAETTDDGSTLHYILKDHLGSWVTITDDKGIIVQENHFDAWGSCQNADNLMFDRGYTGHEHIKGTGLINMNGRLYDPQTSSMLNPDNNIQMPDFTQNLNRYSYCLNNPLTYTDPDGNSFLESALIFYLVYCTDFGYEYQKYTQALAVHIDLHLSSQQIGLGFDFSFGIPKKYGISYRTNLGASYYWRFYDNSYRGFEFRLGGEWCAASCIGYAGTTFYQSKGKQTTNSIILGTYWCNFTYENDYMFDLAKYIPCVPAADGGDRYRSAAARFRLGIISVGVNMFTGDPGVDHDVRRTFNDPDAEGRETYTISANGDNPDEYRAGVLYVGFGPFKIGANSEQIRNLFQNRFAHDLLCRGDSPYFKVLNRPSHSYFYFGTETGSTLW